jgi:SARP family transcriptional regulator, regulator of embCAB operon
VCGRLAVELAGRDVTAALPGGQGRLVFVFLAVEWHRAVRREELIASLWPDEPPEGADSGLSALLSRLRKVLGDGVLLGRGEVRMVLPADTWIDLEAAEEAIHRAESAVAQGAWTRGWGPSLVALFAARRGFLPGCDLPWAERQRGRLEEIHASALECYASVALGVGGAELPTGERCARELVALFPYREPGYAVLMELLAARGSVAEALRVFETLRLLLREELGASPGAELQALQSRLLRTGH